MYCIEDIGLTRCNHRKVIQRGAHINTVLSINRGRWCVVFLAGFSLAEVPSTGCVYHRGDGETLVGYSDSDHAGDVDSRKHLRRAVFPREQSNELEIT